jgi:hypothetical protein
MTEAPTIASWFPRTPFWTLVAHSVKRLISSQQEDTASLSFGLGTALAILASPGAFATLFLLGQVFDFTAVAPRTADRSLPEFCSRRILLYRSVDDDHRFAYGPALGLSFS